MTNRETLLALAERVEAMDGPDLFAEIAKNSEIVATIPDHVQALYARELSAACLRAQAGGE